MEKDVAGLLRAETRLLHQQAERSPFIARLLAGRTDRAAYCSLLRNLHPIYQALEAGAVRLASRPGVAQLFVAELTRLPALEADLRCLHGPAWASALPVLPAAAAYAGHLERLGPAQSHRLAAHAYVRYLGDLAGGQQLRAIVARSLHLQGAAGTSFYAFGAPPDVQRLFQDFRVALGRCAEGPAQTQELVAEAKLAFELHLELFVELEAAQAPLRRTAPMRASR